MNLEANIRNTKTKGDLRGLRLKGDVPGVVYGGKEQNQKVSFSKKILKALMEKENFLSNIITLKIEGKEQSVLPREIVFDTITDEPTHVDFLRIVKGGTVILEIPVKFINSENSPGLKRGGVLNIVRRKVELKCPTENIPRELIVDLNDADIGTSFKISSIKLPENVVPTIKGRDFVVATLAAPTVIKEPEKPAEAAEGAEGTEEGVDAKPTDAKDGESKTAAAGDKKEEAKKGEEKKSPAEKK
tara:strand:+ start:143 stop:874 length:732 start_codon:yes stop_codon:yes gene_type:complete